MVEINSGLFQTEMTYKGNLDPETFIKRAKAFDADWRDSKMPKSLTSKWIFFCETKVKNYEITMGLPGGSRNMEFNTTGIIKEAPGGHEVYFKFKPTLMTFIFVPPMFLISLAFAAMGIMSLINKDYKTGLVCIIGTGVILWAQVLDIFLYHRKLAEYTAAVFDYLNSDEFNS